MYKRKCHIRYARFIAMAMAWAVYVTCGANNNPLDFHECFSGPMLFHEKVTKRRKSERSEKDMKEKLRESWGKARLLLKFKLLLLTVFIAD